MPTPPLSSLTQRIAGPRSRAWGITDRAFELADNGRDIIHLGIGDPDLDTPPSIINAANTALRAARTHYSPLAGEAELREMIASTAQTATGAEVTPDNVVVFPGGQCALFAALLCLVEHGDEVIVPEPAYATYDASVQAGGASVVRVPLDRDRDFTLDVGLVEQAITDRTRALLINTPGNPSGAVYDKTTMFKLAALCRERNIWLVSDEVYHTLVYEGVHTSAWSAPGCQDATVLVSSLSKSHAMTGWRLGWAIAPEPLVTALSDLGQCLLFGVSQFIQDAGVTALRDCAAESGEISRVFKRRRNLLCDALSAVEGLGVHRPAGGMFVLVDVSRFGMSGEQFADALLDEAGVAVVPGFAFGDSVADHVRIGFLVEEELLREGAERIAGFVARL